MDELGVMVQYSLEAATVKIARPDVVLLSVNPIKSGILEKLFDKRVLWVFLRFNIMLIAPIGYK